MPSLSTMVAGYPEQAEEHVPEAAGKRSSAPPFRSRLAAVSALMVSAATLAVLIAFTARDWPYVLVSVLAGELGISALWIAATNRRFRWWAAVVAVLLVAVPVASLVAVGRGALGACASNGRPGRGPLQHP